MFKLMRFGVKSNNRRFSTAISRRHLEDEGDWFYSSEWWDRSSNSHTVFRENSLDGNGAVSVLTHPSSKPDRSDWARTEKYLEQRYEQFWPGHRRDGKFRVAGYQWRTLHFNDATRESTVKVMAVCRANEPGSLQIMQQPHCLAVPYVKSMVSTGLATFTASNYNLIKNVTNGNKEMKILCIGHGGGSIPLFMASKLQGAIVHVVEIDPIVISASTQAMGFPSFSVMTPCGNRAYPKLDPIEELLWKGTHERLLLFNSDAEKFILETPNVYDMIFIDAYDGDDIFPHKLWDPSSPFIKALGNHLHRDHGTVVVNLHTEGEVNGKYVTDVCHSYKDALLEKDTGLAFTLSVPWLYNTSLVVCRGLGRPEGVSGWSTVLHSLMSNGLEVDRLLEMPFSCLHYLKRDFSPV